MTDLAQLLLGAVDGMLGHMSLRWQPDEHALTVVLASEGYPGAYVKGTEIRGLDALAGDPGLLVFHAGTRRAVDGRLLADGGQVLGVTGMGATLAEARDRAYAAVDRIDWPEGFCRRDIGRRTLALRAPARSAAVSPRPSSRPRRGRRRGGSLARAQGQRLLVPAAETDPTR